MWFVYVIAYCLVGALCATWRDSLVFAGGRWSEWRVTWGSFLLAMLWPAGLPAWLAARILLSRPYRVRTRLAYRLTFGSWRRLDWEKLDRMRRRGPVCSTCERYGRSGQRYCHRCGGELSGRSAGESSMLRELQRQREAQARDAMLEMHGLRSVEWVEK